jgi:hypothetical protein
MPVLDVHFRACLNPYLRENENPYFLYAEQKACRKYQQDIKRVASDPTHFGYITVNGVVKKVEPVSDEPDVFDKRTPMDRLEDDFNKLRKKAHRYALLGIIAAVATAVFFLFQLYILGAVAAAAAGALLFYSAYVRYKKGDAILDKVGEQAVLHAQEYVLHGLLMHAERKKKRAEAQIEAGFDAKKHVKTLSAHDHAKTSTDQAIFDQKAVHHLAEIDKKKKRIQEEWEISQFAHKELEARLPKKEDFAEFVIALFGKKNDLNYTCIKLKLQSQFNAYFT